MLIVFGMFFFFFDNEVTLNVWRGRLISFMFRHFWVVYLSLSGRFNEEKEQKLEFCLCLVAVALVVNGDDSGADGG